MWSTICDIIDLFTYKEPTTEERIEAIVNRCCNSEGKAKKCPERIARNIYLEIVEPLENKLKGYEGNK